ncbi:MAG TPA: diguanylate cyclase [Mycobacteriales bacterium]|nr:diguanylate cyclase [Mycobacteriales bacterium]
MQAQGEARRRGVAVLDVTTRGAPGAARLMWCLGAGLLVLVAATACTTALTTVLAPGRADAAFSWGDPLLTFFFHALLEVQRYAPSMLMTGAGLLLLLRARAEPAARAAWAALALGLLLFGAAGAGSVLLYGEVPEISPLDALWLAMYPASYVGIVLLLRAETGRLPASAWLDGLVAGLGVATIAAAGAVHRLLSLEGGNRLAVLVNLAYPVGDLALLALVAGGLVALGRPLPRRWWFLAAGLATLAVGDAVYLLTVAGGVGSVSTWIEAWIQPAWALGAVLVGVAGWQRAPLTRQDLHGPRTWVLPATMCVVALALLTLARETGPVVLALSAATLLTGFARTALAIHDVQRLVQNRVDARTDPLTGLPNRRALLERLRDPARPGKGGHGPALLLVDVDRFKEVNDALGHTVGDELLRQVGARLRVAAGERAMVARLGGDEYAVLVEDAPESEAVACARAILGALAPPVVLRATRLHVAASIGIAADPDGAARPDALLQRADIAMYRAKAAGDGYAVYADADADGSRRRLETIEELREALADDALVVYYQPKLTLGDARVIGAEALVRWPHPTRGAVSPAEFVPLAETAGLSRWLTRHVLATALADCRRWHDAGAPLEVAVNVSARDLDDGTVEEVRRLLERTGLPPAALVIEITESALLRDQDRAEAALAELQATGVQLSIDDFGTGYSSLSRLRKLAVSEIKVDSSFVRGVTTSDDDLAIVRSTVDLGHSLGLRVVAEGVETADVQARLAALRCDAAQGFLLARPMRADAFAAWLAGRPVAALPELSRPSPARPAPPALTVVREPVPPAVPAPAPAVELPPEAPRRRPLEALLRGTISDVGPVAIGFGLGWLGLAATAVAVGTRLPHADVWAAWSYLPPATLAAVSALRCSRATHLPPRSRRAWGWLTAGLFAYLVGAAIEAGARLLVGPTEATTWDDPAYVAFYVLMAIGLVHLAEPLGSRANRMRVATDAAIVAVAGAVALWFFLLADPPRDWTALDPRYALVYPVACAVLVVGVAVALMRAVPRPSLPSVHLLAAGLALFVSTDMAFGYTARDGSYHAASVLDLGWLGSLVLCWFAAHRQVARRPRAAVPVGGGAGHVVTPVNWLPHVAAANTLVLLVLQARHQPLYPLGGLLLAAAALTALVTGRQYAALRDNARLLAEYHHIAATDGLTGLQTRRRFMELAEQECRRSRSSGRTLAAVMIDIDHFKALNDEFGHQAGDVVLQAVADAARAEVRPADLIGRYGGDELVVLLHGAASEDAHRVAERLRERVRRVPVLIADRNVTITLSIGIASGSGSVDLAELLRRADAALYDAKRAGRDCTRSFLAVG